MSQVAMWEYVVDPGHVTEFEELYGPSGDWVQLFRCSPGYQRTEMLRDRERPTRFVTIDFWESSQAREEWRAEFDARYAELDRRGEGLTLSQREIGRFDLIGNG